MHGWQPVTTGQWVTTSDGRTWWFDPGTVALDAVYTGSFLFDRRWEQWHQPTDLDRWVLDHLDVTGHATATDLAEATTLRDAIAALFHEAAGPAIETAQAPLTTAAAQEVVDAYAGRPDLPPQLRTHAEATVSSALATLARHAVVVLRDDRDRLRVCAADDCPLLYLDTSRSGNRTWCSMARCGNRHKVRAARARATTTAKEQPS